MTKTKAREFWLHLGWDQRRLGAPISDCKIHETDIRVIEHSVYQEACELIDELKDALEFYNGWQDEKRFCLAEQALKKIKEWEGEGEWTTTVE